MYIDKKTNKIYSQQQIERKLRKSKARLIDIQQRDFGYNFCEQCKTANGRFDCSHILPVKKCKESGQTEKNSFVLLTEQLLNKNEHTARQLLKFCNLNPEFIKWEIGAIKKRKLSYMDFRIKDLLWKRVNWLFKRI